MSTLKPTQAHHLIPNQWRDHDLFKALTALQPGTTAKTFLDAPRNLLHLPTTNEASARLGAAVHNGSHPRASARVQPHSDAGVQNVLAGRSVEIPANLSAAERRADDPRPMQLDGRLYARRALGIAEYLLAAVRGVGRIIAVGRGRLVVDEPMRNWCGAADGIRGGGTSRLSQWRDARARLCTETIAKGTPERKWWLHCFDLGHNSRPLGIGNDRFWGFFFIFGLFTYFLYANSTVVGAEIFDSSELDRIFQNERESAVIAACAGNVDRNGVTLRIKTTREKLELKDEPDRYFPLDGGLTPWLRVFRLEECNSEKEYYMVRIYNQGDWDYALIDWRSGRMTSLTSNNWNFRADRKSFVVVNDPDSGFVGSVQYVERNASLGWRLIWLYETTASRQEFIGWISDDEFLVRFVRYQSPHDSGREWTMRFRIMPVGFIAVDD